MGKTGETKNENKQTLLGTDLPSVCIIYGHPSSAKGHGAKVLQTVMDTLQDAGAPFDVINLYSQNFEPVMGEWEAENYGKQLGEDVRKAQETLARSPVWIILYPAWWSSPPAMLKGFIDRVLTPGFAFDYEGSRLAPRLGSKKALVVRTFGGPASFEQKNGHVAQKLMEGAILGACGIKAVAVDIYSVDTLASTAFNHALFQLRGAVRRVLSTPTGVPHELRSVPAPYLPPIERAPLAPKLGTEGVDEEGGKPELSLSAKEDLEFFRAAKKTAVEKVHRRASNRQGGKNQNQQSRDGRYETGRGGGLNAPGGRGRFEFDPSERFGRRRPDQPRKTQDRGAYFGRDARAGRPESGASFNANRPGGQKFGGGQKQWNQTGQQGGDGRHGRRHGKHHKGRRF